jgi:hypothetical protein
MFDPFRFDIRFTINNERHADYRVVIRQCGAKGGYLLLRLDDYLMKKLW